MQSNLDFSSLQQLKSNGLSLKNVIILFWVCAFFGLAILDGQRVETMVILPGLVVFFVLFIGLLLWQSQERLKKTTTALTLFAQRNNFTHSVSDSNTALPGSLFQEGHTQKINNVIAGSLGAFPFRSFEYRYNTGSGKSETTHDAMVFEVSLPRVLPQFVIDSQLESVLPITFDHAQKIELEGDFHKYFDLYAPDSYGVSALTILAPDAMEVLMQHAALCDIEVVQDRLYFYWPVPARSEEQYRQIFETATALLNKIGEALSRKDIFATQDQAQLHVQSAHNGVRLKRARIGWVAGLIIVGYILLQFIGLTPWGEYGTGLVALFWCALLLVVFFAHTKRQQLRKEYLNRYHRTYKV